MNEKDKKILEKGFRALFEFQVAMLINRGCTSKEIHDYFNKDLNNDDYEY
jgi:hypothetical protein